MRSRQRDLRTGHPVWRAYTQPRIPVTPLSRDVSCDVLVMGAGISGAMVAEELTDAGLSVIMVDRRGPMKGSTAASTALVQYELDVPFINLSKKIGVEKSMRAWRRSKIAVDGIAAKLRSNCYDCGYTDKASLYLAGTTLDGDELQEEMELRRHIGLWCDYLENSDLQEEYGFSHRGGALRCQGSLAINPLAFTACFLRSSLSRGMRIHVPVTLTHVEALKTHVNAYTADGPVIRARHVVFAGGYELPQQVTNRRHHVYSTYAFATKPQGKKWAQLPFMWEAADPYLYIRPTDDGRIICGGEDEEFSDEATRDALLDKKTAVLQKKLQKLFPSLDVAADYSWCGSFGSSSTGLPAIGPVRGLKNCYAVMAFGGNGITFSRIGAEIIRGAITGQPDPDADLYAL